MGYINVGQGDATFHLFHGECEDYKREFILPLEDILNERGAVRVFLDYGKLTYVSRKEALAINRLKKTISLYEIMVTKLDCQIGYYENWELLNLIFHGMENLSK